MFIPKLVDGFLSTYVFTIFLQYTLRLFFLKKKTIYAFDSIVGRKQTRFLNGIIAHLHRHEGLNGFVLYHVYLYVQRCVEGSFLGHRARSSTYIY